MRISRKRPMQPEQQPVVPPGAKFLSVDPGLSGTGWAVWGPGQLPPLRSGSLSAPADRDWLIRARWLGNEVRHLAESWGVDYVVIEQPQFMESAGKGLIAAREGDLVKLSILVGVIAAQHSHSVLVEVREWKGSMSKEVSHRRIRSKLPGWVPCTATSHEMDAVGIGLFAKGVM